MSLWVYECIYCWNFDVIDFNCLFCVDSLVGELVVLWNLLVLYCESVLLYIDLYEIIDSDELEFCLVLVVCDGVVYELGEIFDGFYLVDDIENL